MDFSELLDRLGEYKEHIEQIKVIKDRDIIFEGKEMLKDYPGVVIETR